MIISWKIDRMTRRLNCFLFRGVIGREPLSQAGCSSCGCCFRSCNPLIVLVMPFSFSFFHFLDACIPDVWTMSCHHVVGGQVYVISS